MSEADLARSTTITSEVAPGGETAANPVLSPTGVKGAGLELCLTDVIAVATEETTLALMQDDLSDVIGVAPGPGESAVGRERTDAERVIIMTLETAPVQ